MILKRLNRTELIERIERCVNTLKHSKSSVTAVNRHGYKLSVIKVEEREEGVFLYPMSQGNPALALAPLFGSEMHEYGAEELVTELKKCRSEEVWLQWPTSTLSTVPGYVTAIGHGDELSVHLWPVPKDIDEVNERVREICAENCPLARSGMQCGECPNMMDCEVIRNADEKITKEKESK